MEFRINGEDIAVKPYEFQVTILDLDDADSTTRTADGTMTRDRVAVKRQIEISWNALQWGELSEILQSMGDVFFELYYPDSMTGQYEMRTFYVGNRSSPVAIEKNGVMWWSGLQLTLTEK